MTTLRPSTLALTFTFAGAAACAVSGAGGPRAPEGAAPAEPPPIAAPSIAPTIPSNTPASDAGPPPRETAAPGAEVIRQLLDLPAGKAVAAQDFTITARTWHESYAVVLVKGKDVRVAALGLYAAGNTPWASRLLARSGHLDVPEDEAVADLDLAPFRVSATEIAIGLRFDRTRAYAGGFGQASVLHLYLRREGRLESIFSAALQYTCMLAGGFHPDGTRDHVEVKGQSILDVATTTTAGHFDLVQRSGRKTITTFRWDGQRYVSSPAAQTGWNDCEIVDNR